MIVIVGIALQFSGFTPNQDQSETTLLTLRSIYAGLPFTTYLVGALLFRKFALDESTHAEVLAELAKRRGAPSA